MIWEILNLKKEKSALFKQLIFLLNSVQKVKQVEWNYEIPFVGFQLFLEEKNIENYTMILDKEGDCQNTLKAAGKK